MSKQGWYENEITAAVDAYLGLLDAETRSERVNKSAICHDLERRFKNRSAKAFELKFQNISAVSADSMAPFAFRAKDADIEG